MSLFKKSNERLYNLKENLKKIGKKTALGLTAVLTGVFASGCRPISQDEAINVMKNETSSDKIEEIIEVAQQDDNTITLKSGAEVILPELEQKELIEDEAKAYFGEYYDVALETLKNVKENFQYYYLSCHKDESIYLDAQAKINNEDVYISLDSYISPENESIGYFGDKDTNSAIGITKFDNEIDYQNLSALHLDGDRIMVYPSPSNINEEGGLGFTVFIEYEGKLYLVGVSKYLSNYPNNYYIDGDSFSSDIKTVLDKDNLIAYTFVEFTKLTEKEFYQKWEDMIKEVKEFNKLETKQNESGLTN